MRISKKQSTKLTQLNLKRPNSQKIKASIVPKDDREKKLIREWSLRETLGLLNKYW